MSAIQPNSIAHEKRIADGAKQIAIVALDMSALALKHAREVMDRKAKDPLHAERYTELADRLSQIADRLHQMGERARTLAGGNWNEPT